METKQCTKCKAIKETKFFYRDKQKKEGIGSWCKSCLNKNAVEYRKNGFNIEQVRFNQTKFSTGITREQYELLLKNQNNKCAICKTEYGTTNKKFSVDHCHDSNLVRGLLCSRCNLGLGYFKDDINLLEKAIYYINNNQSHVGLKMKNKNE
jgi:hypothetical protein